MTRGEIRRFKRVLEDLKAELVYAVQNSLDRLVISQSADPMDQMRDLTDQEVDSRNISVLTTRLRSLESALRAIQEGRFGRCISCDSEIPKKRLEAIPWSTHCVRCQETAETQVVDHDDADKSIGRGYAIAG